jgi:hypothetical protein
MEAHVIDNLTWKGPRCLACERPMLKSRTLSPKELGRPSGPGSGFAIRMCPQCGHLTIPLPDGSSRNLTAAEKQRLPRHRYVKQIRKAQERIVAKLWG